MAPLPSRKSLESMKRVDLQRICKNYGVKANLKSDALIDLLLDAAPSATVSVPTAGPVRTSSIVIHDTDDGNEGKKEPPNTEKRENSSPALSQSTVPAATRTRKGKDQTRLGVGRPVIAGSSGPRAVTKSISKGRQRKTSRGMKPTEATIIEENEQGSIHASEDSIMQPAEGSQQAIQNRAFPGTSIELLAVVDKCVADALRPLHEQMKSMKSELELMQTLKTEVHDLKAQMDDTESLRAKVETLTFTVRELRKEIGRPTTIRSEPDWDNEPNPAVSTPKTGANATGMHIRLGDAPFLTSEQVPHQEPSSLRSPSDDINTNKLSSRPSLAPGVLGKRRRGSGASQARAEDATGVETSEGKHVRKRAKRSVEKSPPPEQAISIEDIPGEAVQGANEEFQMTGRYPSFAIFSGLEESPIDLDPPPPTEHLPEFFIPSPPLGMTASSPIQQGPTSSANAIENPPGFAFSFKAGPSTPAPGMFLPSFPYPEPPQSPSPAQTNTSGLLRRGNHAGVFQSFGFHPRQLSRVISLQTDEGLVGNFIDPATLTSEVQTREVASHTSDTHNNEVASQATDVGSNTSTGSSNEPGMKRTMYGTELDGDTRFGDFGVEGVGQTNTFWAGGRY